MTTMASTSHGLSVWANTCIKCPVNPKTGLNATLHDENTSPVRCDNVLLERDDNQLLLTTSETNKPDLINTSTTTSCRHYCSTAYDKISTLNLKGDEFYDKLQKLKEENTKTLEAFEKLYQHKILLESAQANKYKSYEFDPVVVANVASSFIEFDNTKPLEIIANNVFSKQEETIESKPPSGKFRETLSHTPIQSESVPQRSTRSTKHERPGSAPTERRSHSLDHNYWNKSHPGSRDSSENFIIPQEKISNKYEQALAKVDKLWEDFNISEYSQRRHSFSSRQEKNRQSGKIKTSEWRHRLTVPQPFKMSIREALKEKKRTSAQEEVEQKRLAKLKQEEAECEKKFKAQPVPAHVYLPKFEEIMERNETRRKYVKEVCKELLQSQVKPFSFDMRENEKKLRRAHSAPIRRPDETSNIFKARPVPKHIFSPDIDDKLLEEEELRKIRLKMRSKELLRESSLPPNMALREELKEQERKEKRKLVKLAAKKRHQRNTHDIPNYNALYNQFKKELERRRNEQKGTVIEPFHFETELIHAKNDKIRTEIENNENRLKDTRWPFQNSKKKPNSYSVTALSNSVDYIPGQSSRSAELRYVMTKKKKDRSENRQKEEEEAEKRRRTRQTKMQRYLSMTNILDIPKPRDSIAERLKKIRKEDSERQEAYEREIEDMNARVQKSPLLIEKYMAEYARTAAEKKFKAALNSAGLNDKEFVSAKSSSERRDLTTGGNNTGDHGDNNNILSSAKSGDLTYINSTSDE